MKRGGIVDSRKKRRPLAEELHPIFGNVADAAPDERGKFLGRGAFGNGDERWNGTPAALGRLRQPMPYGGKIAFYIRIVIHGMRRSCFPC
jgi:hypothetical protein